MTVKEIAEAVGKTDRAIRNWANSAAENNSVIAEKISASTSTHPADYTLSEVIEIIRTGAGDSIADTFATNAQDQSQPKNENKLSERMLQQIRLSVRDGLLTKEEGRHILGVEKITEPVAVVEYLGRISKQAYAVEKRVRREQMTRQIEDNRSPDLFTEQN